jgi:aquaporin Z
MNKLIVEFIGTFFLVLAVGLTGNPLAIGAMLMVMVYAGGHISGAHYNPAVSLAMIIRGKISGTEAVKYIVVQVLGSFAASFLIYLIDPAKLFALEPIKDFHLLKPLAVEMVCTFALVYVVLNVATHSKTAGNSFYGLAIGFTITACAFAGGPFSGGAFNPAVATGPLLTEVIAGNTDSAPFIWIYIVGPITGGLVAALLFKYLNPEEK